MTFSCMHFSERKVLGLALCSSGSSIPAPLEAELWGSGKAAGPEPGSGRGAGLRGDTLGTQGQPGWSPERL